MILGAVAGDIIGSRFEFKNWKRYNFELFHEKCRFTDDTVCTLAIAQAILNCGYDYSLLSKEAINMLQLYCKNHITAGYGGNFRQWIQSDNPQPYNSWGNGAAMRVSASGWAGRTLEETIQLAKAVTEITHDHPEGIKAAVATATAIYIAKMGGSKQDIQTNMNKFYPIDFKLRDLRSDYHFDVSSQGTMPVALEAFYEGRNYEEVIRLVMSMGGDSDTLGAIAGSIAGAYYGVPYYIQHQAFNFLSEDLKEIVIAFEHEFGSLG